MIPATFEINARETLVNTALGLLANDDANPQVGMGMLIQTAVRKSAEQWKVELTEQEFRSLIEEVVAERQRG